jgi:hypothetical protein
LRKATSSSVMSGRTLKNWPVSGYFELSRKRKTTTSFSPDSRFSGRDSYRAFPLRLMLGPLSRSVETLGPTNLEFDYGDEID